MQNEEKNIESCHERLNHLDHRLTLFENYLQSDHDGASKKIMQAPQKNSTNKILNMIQSTSPNTHQTDRRTVALFVNDSVLRKDHLDFDREVVVLAVVGEGRVGKSTFLNFVAAWLAEQGIVSGVDTEGIALFRTGNTIDPVTRDVDSVLLHLQNGKMLLLIDMEGLCNRDRPELDLLLAAVSQLTGHVVFMEKSISDTFRSSLGRMVCAGMMLVNEGGAIVWPKLHVILNMSRTDVGIDTLARAFAPGAAVTEETSQVSTMCRLFLLAPTDQFADARSSTLHFRLTAVILPLSPTLVWLWMAKASEKLLLPRTDKRSMYGSGTYSAFSISWIPLVLTTPLDNHTRLAPTWP